MRNNDHRPLPDFKDIPDTVGTPEPYIKVKEMPESHQLVKKEYTLQDFEFMRMPLGLWPFLYVSPKSEARTQLREMMAQATEELEELKIVCPCGCTGGHLTSGEELMAMFTEEEKRRMDRNGKRRQARKARRQER